MKKVKIKGGSHYLKLNSEGDLIESIDDLKSLLKDRLIQPLTYGVLSGVLKNGVTVVYGEHKDEGRNKLPQILNDKEYEINL